MVLTSSTAKKAFLSISRRRQSVMTSKQFSSMPKPWENRFFLTNGDYTQDSWVEDPSTPLYEHQTKLPRLPVPELAETASKFLSTALPLAQSNTEAENLQVALSKFPSQAKILQDRLIQRAEEWNHSSWLQKWWNQMGYLDVRDSVVINVSYFFAFVDDPTAQNQVQRAATLLTAVADVRKQIVTKQMPAEAIGKQKTKLCSAAYKYMFHSCRIPEIGQDQVKVYDPAVYKHAVVAVRGQFFAIDFLDEFHNALPVETIEASLEDCLRQANQAFDKIGVCTSMNRDDWANARAVLLPNHSAALEKLESGAVLICLDTDEEPVSKAEMAELMLHGKNGWNRWYDKSIQLIVTKNGKAGLMGEHAMMDGMPVVNFADTVTKLKYSDIAKSGNTGIGSASRIFQEALPHTIQPHIEKAQHDFEVLTQNNQLSVCRFDGYGASFMKKAGYSPDAFAQMVMQIATYRLWNGQQGGTYEATQVRPFLHGRTETTRTVSNESAHLCQLFGVKPVFDEHDASARKEKLQALDKACRAHVNYLRMAGNGQGVDRHFFGLSCLVEANETLPDLFQDPVFQRSKRWRVSTSHLTHPKFETWGYGPVVSDGVGLAYSVHPRHCVFTVTARKEHDWTEKLCSLLEETLVELRTTIEVEELENEPTKSRL